MRKFNVPKLNMYNGKLNGRDTKDCYLYDQLPNQCDLE